MGLQHPQRTRAVGDDGAAEADKDSLRNGLDAGGLG
jgi:hypothetical protein